MSLRRIKKDLEDFNKNRPHYLLAEPLDESDMYIWRAMIKGPPDSDYEDGVFSLEILFSSVYPFKPPQVRFITKIYHPNINENGDINLITFKDQWNPALTILQVLHTICSLMYQPSSDDSIVPEIAKILSQNRRKFEKNVKEWILKYAT